MANKTPTATKLNRVQKADIQAFTTAQKAANTRAANKKAALFAAMTPGQKAAFTKRENGLDLSAIANKAVTTRRFNDAAIARYEATLTRGQKAAYTKAQKKAA